MLKHIFILSTILLIILSCNKDKIEKEPTNKEDISVSINIDNDEKDVSISREIVIDFSDKVVKLDGSDINDKNVREIFSFKQGDNKGKEVAFNISIANDKKKITIKPNLLKKSTKYYFRLDGKRLKGVNGEKVLDKEIVFTTRIDNTKDIGVSININNNENDVSISRDIVIDFSDKVVKLDGSEINDKNMGEVFSFREGNNKGKEVAFDISIANDKKKITIKPKVLNKSTKYYFKVDGKKLKGKNGAKVIVKEIVFTTEDGFIGPLNITDPLYKKQWHLKNTGQFGYTKGIDIKVESVWKKGYNGSGISVGIMDDLVDATHPDLRDNISSANVVNYFPGADRCKHNHGTAVAGIIAARDNNIGVIGIAYRSKLYAYSVFNSAGETSTDIILKGLKRNENSEIAVYNFSLGDQGEEWDYTRITNSQKYAMDLVTQKGFGGLGSSLVFAAGNLGLYGVSTNTSFTNHYATINVNGVTGRGYHKPAFSSTQGQNIWIAGPTTGISTTDNAGKCGDKDGDYIDNFSGSSAAAPMVTGVVALMRQANPNLTWRDVKLILAESANKNIAKGANYLVSGKMYSDPSKDQSYSEYLGFGFLDASKAIDLATNWTNLPKEKVFTASSNTSIDVSAPGKEHQTKINITGSNMTFIESVTIEINLENAQEVSLSGPVIRLISPDNKISEFYKMHVRYQFHFDNYDSFVLLSNAFLGSSTIDGEWTFSLKQFVENKFRKAIKKIKSWTITIRGH